MKIIERKVRSSSQNNRVLILLGSNSPDPLFAIDSAISKIIRYAKIHKTGSLFSSKSWGFTGRDFLNQMIEVEWQDSLSELMITLLKIEEKLGRIRNTKSNNYENRIIDIDIILWSGGQYVSDNLKVPHPRMNERLFVLVPLCEYWADWIHPIEKTSMDSLLASCSDENLVHLYNINEKK
tara:strand:- start:841 stop:1380 length:540 start_codon:yes stop_codon:yes gene_type:complete